VEDKVLQLFQEVSSLIVEFGQRNSKVIIQIAHLYISCFEAGGKLLLFGNGGSASEAQHFSAELINKLVSYRKPLPAIALTTDTSVLTSIGNDLDFNDIFSRQIEALGKKSDVAWGMSTSGNSPNLIKAFNRAKELGLITVAFSGNDGGAIANITDYCLTVPSQNTAYIQEVHSCIGHAICTIIEEHFLQKQNHS
jgi:D-sedoheptulose 7-phosphate isomerase